MKAIRKIPILGRQKIVVDKKPCGRNELIADFIYRRTGNSVVANKPAVTIDNHCSMAKLDLCI